MGSVAVLAVIGGSAAGAQAKPAFSVQPAVKSKTGYFVIHARPGQNIRQAVEVLNTGTTTGSARIYAVDGTTGQTSGAVYRSRQQRRRDVGAWVDLSRRKVTVGPRRKVRLRFTVSVPRGAFSGQHLGGIVVQPSGVSGGKVVKKKNRASFQVKIRELSVVAVQVDLPGRRIVEMGLTGIRAGGIPGRQRLLIGISNLGNVFVKCDGSLSVANGAGRRVKRSKFALDTFVSHTHIAYPLYTAGKPLPNGTYKGTVGLTCRDHHVARTFPFKVTAANQRDVYGTTARQTGAGSTSDHTLLYALLGTIVALLGAIAFSLYRIQWRERRI